MAFLSMLFGFKKFSTEQMNVVKANFETFLSQTMHFFWCYYTKPKCFDSCIFDGTRYLAFSIKDSFSLTQGINIK